jgi:hypothetical protein
MSLFTPQEMVTKCLSCNGVGVVDDQKCMICDGTGYVPYLEPRSIFRMTPEERQAIMTANPPEITSVHYGSAYFDWSWMGCGSGQLSFSVDRATGQITFMDEHMGKERVRTILHQFVDHLVENGKFDERG